MPNGILERIVRQALGLLRDGLGNQSLADSLRLAAEFEGEDPPSVNEVMRHVGDAPAGDPVRLVFHRQLAEWDALSDGVWVDRTPHQTRDRRLRIYELLELPPDGVALFDRLFPTHLVEDPGFEIARDFERWYNAERAETGFYWPRYRDHLRIVERWDIGVEDLARATKQVMERLGRPERGEVVQARGLVVGYVQSGKTAHFTGVITRAIDAGYRLIIILAGTTNLLRSQTQRRLDKQLVGAELLMSIAADERYQDAPDWENFIRYGAPPHELGTVDVHRLTTLENDYRRLRGGLATLEFRPHIADHPLNAHENLERINVRLAVVKKNRAPLQSLARDLQDVRRGGVRLEEIPTLIIDDESDQASINTKKPTRRDIENRTAINRAITDLLTLLPRAQYVGYTATPFANVFVDPNDELGIYPRDFIIGLDRPERYMGASDYHDFGEQRQGFSSNERAYVRPVYGGDLADDNLRQAVDLYLLTGALKLYRAAEGIDIDTKHHTMLVHTSEKTAVHRETAQAVRGVIDRGGYDDGTAEPRLIDLLEEELRAVSAAKAPELPFPDNYAELRPHVAACLQRLQEGIDPVLIVNGLRENEPLSPDFDRESVWAIIVGGTKLSRGYTVEGLTISYYRRRTRAADTLMQMGRWFGFRRNYEDLMRLFIGRAEGPPTRPIDLYKAFEAVCQDELELRRELRRYSLPETGEPVTPLQVAPLVTQHLPALPPTAPNKMWNADLLSQNYGGEQIARTLAPTDQAATRRNERRARELLADGQLATRRLGPAGSSFRAQVGAARPDEMIDFLDSYEWSKEGVLERVLTFLRGEIGDPEISSWTVVLPLLEDVSPMGAWSIGNGEEVTIIERFRDPDTGRFGVYTAPVHVSAARAIASGEDLDSMTAETRALGEEEGMGVALFYAVKAAPDDPVTIGFALFPPPNHIEEKLRWHVHVPELEDQAVVERD